MHHHIIHWSYSAQLFIHCLPATDQEYLLFQGQLQMYTMAQNHNSLYNFVYCSQPQFPQPQLPGFNTAYHSFYNFVYGHDHAQAQFPQYGSKEYPIDVDELQFPEYVVNNFDLNMSPSPENMPPLTEIDEVQEVIDISDDDSELDSNPYQIQHQEPSAIIYYKPWQHYHSPVHDWGGIAPLIQPHAIATQPSVPVPHQPTALSSTMAQFTTGETTSEYGMEVSSQPNLLNFTNYLRFF